MEDTTSLFNYRNPRSMMADRFAAQRQAPSGSLDEMTVQLGGNAGSLIGNALFGGRTSAMAEQAVLNEAIKESEVAEDPDERLSLFANALRKRGLEGYAQKVDAQLQGRLQAKATAESATQQQAALTRLVMSKTGLGQAEAAALAKDPATVRELMKETQAKVSTFGQQLIDAGFAPGSPEYVAQMRKFVDKELTPSKSIGTQLAEGLSPLVGAIAEGQAKKAGETSGAAVGKDTAAIQGKEDALIALTNASKLLKNDKGQYAIYSGFYGPAVTTAVKATGGLAGDRQKVVQTEKFLNEVRTTVIPLLAEFGGNDSNEELKFLQGLVGGDQTLEPESIDAILKSAQAKIKRGIKRTQEQQKAVVEGRPLPTEVSNQPKATKRFNQQTGRIEIIKD